MIIPKQNIKQIYQYLFNGIVPSPFDGRLTFFSSLEGVLVVKKDVNLPKHPEIPVPNIEVMSALKSLKSRGYVTEQFSWMHFYFYLTDEGILFLRQYLHLPETAVPLTIAKAQRAAARVRGEGESASTPGDRRRGENADGGYRRSNNTGSQWRGGEQRQAKPVTA